MFQARVIRRYLHSLLVQTLAGELLVVHVSNTSVYDEDEIYTFIVAQNEHGQLIAN